MADRSVVLTGLGFLAISCLVSLSIFGASCYLIHLTLNGGDLLWGAIGLGGFYLSYRIYKIFR